MKGSITVASPLDREDKDSYTLVVQAWDNYDYGFSTGESRKAFKQVNILNFYQLYKLFFYFLMRNIL